MKPLSVYIHIPFCQSKCPYCDFESSRGGDHAAYTAELCNEITAGAKQAAGYIVNTVYFGGGTPSYIDAKYIGQILQTLRDNVIIAKDAEI